MSRSSSFRERTLSIDQIIQHEGGSGDDRSEPLSYHRKPVSNIRSNRLSLQSYHAPPQKTHESRPQSMRLNSRVGLTDIDEGYYTGRTDKGAGRQSKTTVPAPPRIGDNFDTTGESGRVGHPTSSMSNMTDFFSSEVFHIVLHNPTTAHRLLKFSQSRACGENIEFLQRISLYVRLLDEMATALGAIHADFLTPGAPNHLNLSNQILKDVSSQVKEATTLTLPGLEFIFAGAQYHVERLLANDIYPRFVKHQITASATVALMTDRERFSGLGDCFCLTDPHMADNPIVYASDGFVSVTGYSRRDIIPRNCRFLQGKQTDPKAIKRLRISIDQCEETVELLLNYRKNGDPFWNLLYCAPLFNERGQVTYFLGGQVNCSTTIHSCTDVLKVLSVNDDELDQQDRKDKARPQTANNHPTFNTDKHRNSFFKSWKKYKANTSTGKSDGLHVRDDVGMEGELLGRVGMLNFKTQVEAFYTAYSKYLVLQYSHPEQSLIVQHFSTGIIDMLHLNLPNGSIIPIYNKDIFAVLSDHSPSRTTTAKFLKNTVRTALKEGRAVSIEIGLMTGFSQKKNSGWFGGSGGGSIGSSEQLRRVEEKYVTHWTPLKSGDGSVRRVVLIIVPKI